MVHIYTVSYARPDFIGLQDEQFKRFLSDQYSFTVLNNAKNNIERQKITETCTDLGLPCIEIDSTNYRVDAAGLPALDYCIQNLIAPTRAGEFSVIIDSDVFLFKPFSFIEMARNHDVCTIYQQRVKTKFRIVKKNIPYCWIAFIVLNHKQKNFRSLNLDAILGLTDLGGASYYFLQSERPSVKWVDHTVDLEADGKRVFNEPILGEYKPEFGFQIIAGAFVHYYRGSNWDGMSAHYHQQKTNYLKKILSAGPDAVDRIQLQRFSSPLRHTLCHFDGIRYKKAPWYYQRLITWQMRKFS